MTLDGLPFAPWCVALVFRRQAAGFLDFRRPTPRQAWAAEAEARHIAALAIDARLPPDAPPELVLLCARDKEGRLETGWDLEAARKAAY